MKYWGFRALPYLVALAIPSLIIGGVWSAAGENPIPSGSLSGGIGLFGALLATWVKQLTERRRTSLLGIDLTKQWETAIREPRPNPKPLPPIPPPDVPRIEDHRRDDPRR
jgi:hypothetical protein